MRRHIRFLVSAAAVAGSMVVLHAAPPVFWTVSTQADFLKGHVDGLAVDADGRLRLGPAFETLADPKEPFIWSIAESAGAWLAGTGNDGKVLRVGPGGTATVAFDAAELGVHAVVPDGRGGFYAATGPDGRVHHIDAAGTASVAFDPEDRYIWSLARAADGTLYVGTGDRGVIYRVRPGGGGGDVLYRTRAANVISLAVDPQGRLYAGTSTPGRLFRIDAQGRAFVVIDSPHQEVRGVRVASDGAVFAAALTPARADEAGAADAEPVATVTAQVSGVAVSPASAADATSSDSRRTGRGTIYRVSGDIADIVWETGVETPYDLLPDAAGTGVIVTTGGTGRVYRVDLAQSPARVELMGRVDSQQVTQAARAANGDTVVAGSNPGRLLVLRSRAGRTGTFESEVRDAGSAARWGSIRWRAVGRAAIATRTGNTSRPDDTWSEWSAAYTAVDGSPIVSPSARYLQWRAVLSSDAGTAPELTSVTVAYLPRNLRPAVASVTVLPPGAVFQRPFTSSDAEIAGFDGVGANAEAEGLAQDAAAQSVGRRMYRKGLQTFQWRADDPNGDRLTYVIAYRREGESLWRPLRAGLSDPIFVWDTTSVADGRYSVRVTASDASTNSPGDALHGSRDSDGFDIDNSAPVVTVLPASGDGRIVRLTVRDAQSGVQRVEYALGGGPWQVVYPADGLSDSREETFAITLPAAADRARLVVRATDVLQNVSTRGDFD